MKALILRKHGGLEELTVVSDYPVPATIDGHVVIRVRASSFNYHDVFTVKGMPGIKVPLPVIIGLDMAGEIAEIGDGVAGWKPGDRVLISCISACGKCEYCRKQMFSHCTTGGWILGNTIDGTQAEYVRTPYADNSLYPIPASADEEALVMLSDILPTGFECGVLNGKVQPGSSVAIVGSGPIGLAALLTAKFYSPAQIIMIELDDNR